MLKSLYLRRIQLIPPTLIFLVPRPGIPCIVESADCSSSSFSNLMNPIPLLVPFTSRITKSKEYQYIFLTYILFHQSAWSNYYLSCRKDLINSRKKIYQLKICWQHFTMHEHPSEWPCLRLFPYILTSQICHTSIMVMSFGHVHLRIKKKNGGWLNCGTGCSLNIVFFRRFQYIFRTLLTPTLQQN